MVREKQNAQGSQDAEAGMDIYEVLKQDHEQVKELLSKAQSARSSERRAELVQECKAMVLLHAKTEEQTFYAALRSKPELAEKMQHAKEEHEEVEELFAKISRARADGDNFLILLGELKMGLEHHIKEEEEEIFEKAREVLSEEEAQELGEEMQMLKQKALKSKAA